MAIVVDHFVDIEASPDKVWAILTDFDKYGEWNPLTVECSSSLVPGDPIDMMVRLGRWPLRKQREWVRTHTPGQEFSYTMKPLPGGLLGSLRTQTLTPLDGDRTRYTAHFEIRGWLSPLVKALLGQALQSGFDGVAEGLRLRAEQI